MTPKRPETSRSKEGLACIRSSGIIAALAGAGARRAGSALTKWLVCGGRCRPLRPRPPLPPVICRGAERIGDGHQSVCLKIIFRPKTFASSRLFGAGLQPRGRVKLRRLNFAHSYILAVLLAFKWKRAPPPVKNDPPKKFNKGRIATGVPTSALNLRMHRCT